MNKIKSYMAYILLNAINLSSALAMGDDDQNMEMNPEATGTLNGPRNHLPMNQGPLFMGRSNVLETANIIANPQINPIFLDSTLAFSGNDMVSTDIVLNRDVDIDTRGFNGTLSGDISGTGRLTKIGLGTLILSGMSNYDGGTTVTNGTLIGTTTSLQGDIVNNAAVIFDQTINGTYARVISGTGSLTKIGVGTVTLSGFNTYLGDTVVLNGTLNVTGSIGDITSDVTVAPGASLIGTGIIIGGVTVDGMIGATTVNDVLSINGNLSLGATGDVKCTISSNGNASLLHVNGSVDLNNSRLLVEILNDGDYPQEWEYVIIDSGIPGGLGGSNLSGVVEFGSVSGYILTHRIDDDNQRVILKVAKPIRVPTPISDN